jgi:hypothetical protein
VSISGSPNINSIANPVSLYGNWLSTGFWNAVAVAAGGLSAQVDTNGARIRVLVDVSGATDITIMHSAGGNYFDDVVLQFTGAGAKTVVVDCAKFVKLRSSNAVTITAGCIYIRG